MFALILMNPIARIRMFGFRFEPRDSVYSGVVGCFESETLYGLLERLGAEPNKARLKEASSAMEVLVNLGFKGQVFRNLPDEAFAKATEAAKATWLAQQKG